MFWKMNLKFNPFYAVFSKGRPNTPQDVDLVVVQQAIPPHHLSTSTEVAFNQMFLAASTAPDTLVGCGFAHISLVWIWLIKFLFNLEGSATPHIRVFISRCFGSALVCLWPAGCFSGYLCCIWVTVLLSRGWCFSVSLPLRFCSEQMGVVWLVFGVFWLIFLGCSGCSAN